MSAPRRRDEKLSANTPALPMISAEDTEIKLRARFDSEVNPGVRKYVFAQGDRLLEVGLYPGGRRGVVHLCMSSQWGCHMGCTFCATAALKQSYGNDLAVTQAQWQTIADAILADPVNQESFGELREIGFDWMGMGEPCRNLEQLIPFMQNWNPPPPWADVPVLFRINSVGIPEAIDELAQLQLSKNRIKLYLSVHAVYNRAELVPYDRVAPLQLVLNHAQQFHQQHPEHRVALSYMVLPSVNNSKQDAQKLAQLARPDVFYLRLCNLNQVDHCPQPFTRASQRQMREFARQVRHASRGMYQQPVRIDLFVSRGLDVDVGCGQLCGRLKETP